MLLGSGEKLPLRTSGTIKDEHKFLEEFTISISGKGAREEYRKLKIVGGKHSD